jgi:hypothetical protein
MFPIFERPDIIAAEVPAEFFMELLEIHDWISD